MQNETGASRPRHIALPSLPRQAGHPAERLTVGAAAPTSDGFPAHGAVRHRRDIPERGGEALHLPATPASPGPSLAACRIVDGDETGKDVNDLTLEMPDGRRMAFVVKSHSVPEASWGPWPVRTVRGWRRIVGPLLDGVDRLMARVARVRGSR